MSATGEHGFTLLEMLVVLTIAGLIGGIGFPRVQAVVTAQEWRTSVVSVSALLRLARAQAIRQGGVATVSVAANGREMRIDKGPAISLPASVTAVMPQPIGFHSDGSARGSTVVVTGNGRQTRILVAPATGLLTTRTP